MMKFKTFNTYLVLISTSILNLNNLYAQETTRWPIPDWDMANNPSDSMSTPQCTGFLNLATKSQSFLTDGLVVIKDGQLQYEHYDSKYGVDVPHPLWSVSKTFTGTLLGIAYRDGKISLDQYLNEFFPRANASKEYQKIKIRNLFYLDTGFIWDEYYIGNVKKIPVLNLLYGEGHIDMPNYALDRDVIPAGPGYRFSYSTGTPVVTMGVLKKIYGDEYESMPWKSLFNPLGMKNISFERDHKGVFNGGASVFATPRDMAKVGYLYLNNGMWNGNRILPLDWIDKTLQVSPGYASPGTKIKDITDDGVYGGSIWLNKAVKPGFGRPFPISPDDMYLALGHYGQMVIVLPTQKMVIARTGYDNSYNYRIDEFVSRAISCFSDPNYPIAEHASTPKSAKISLWNTVQTVVSGIRQDIFQKAIAKNICSCHFVSGLDIDSCLDRSNIPFAHQLASVKIDDDRAVSGKYFITAKPRWNKKAATASFDTTKPEFGCTLN